MNKLIFLIPLLFNGCLYINQDIGLTTYQYDKCVEYFDENGTYHKDCPKSDIDKFFKKFLEKIKGESKESGVSDKKEIIYKNKKCVCSKSCVKRCKVKDIECYKKCCYEK